MNLLQRLVHQLRQWAEHHPRASFAAKLLTCLALAEQVELWPALYACLSEVAVETVSEPLVHRLVLSILNFLEGAIKVACTTTHSTQVAGAGTCCAQVQSGALRATAATYPVYTAGYNWASNPSNFPHVQVVDSKGNCATCSIVGSKSTKHPGRPVLHFQRGGPGCPTTSRGCCALTTQ